MINSDVTRTMSVAEATENSRRMNYGVERAVVLTQRLDAMIDDVIDDCYFCSRVRNMVSSSESALEIILACVIKKKNLFSITCDDHD